MGKLKFLPNKHLYKLHDNPFFVAPLSKLKEQLFVLAPPSRSYNFAEVPMPTHTPTHAHPFTRSH